MQVVRGSRRRLALVLGACAAVVAACGPTISPLDPSLRANFLTSEGQDRYGLTVAGDVVTVAAPASNTGRNSRVAFWRAADALAADQQTCATWVNNQTQMQQQGAALRVRTVNGRTRAITVTKNISFGAHWGFNVHVMDSGAAQPFRAIGGFHLANVFRLDPDTVDVPPYPWRMCARVVGNTVSFIVWPLTHAEPSWGDPDYGGSVTLPTGWDQPGFPGWYVGHLRPGESVGFADMSSAVIGWTGTATRTAGTDVVPVEATQAPRDPTWIPSAP